MKWTSPMYISPITIMQGELNVQVEKEIIKAVRSVGVDVDKDELIKALNYDRQQYEKGYEDAMKTMQWIPCSERLPEDTETKIITFSNGLVEAGYYSEKKWWCIGESFNLEIHRKDVVAWIPLPPAYKESED